MTECDIDSKAYIRTEKDLPGDVISWPLHRFGDRVDSLPLTLARYLLLLIL